METCPNCGRHCPENDLHCARGVAYFEKNESSSNDMNKDQHGRHDHHGHHQHHNIDEMDTIGLLRSCGHQLHHGLSDASLEALSKEEQETLNQLLRKLLKSWQ